MAMVMEGIFKTENGGSTATDNYVHNLCNMKIFIDPHINGGFFGKKKTYINPPTIEAL